MTRNKKLLIVLLALAVLTGGYFLYMAWAFPAERCEAAKHLDSPQMAGDCYAWERRVGGQGGSGLRLLHEWRPGRRSGFGASNKSCGWRAGEPASACLSCRLQPCPHLLCCCVPARAQGRPVVSAQVPRRQPQAAAQRGGLCCSGCDCATRSHCDGTNQLTHACQCDTYVHHDAQMSASPRAQAACMQDRPQRAAAGGRKRPRKSPCYCPCAPAGRRGSLSGGGHPFARQSRKRRPAQRAVFRSLQAGAGPGRAHPLLLNKGGAGAACRRLFRVTPSASVSSGGRSACRELVRWVAARRRRCRPTPDESPLA